ncbi:MULTISPECIES: DNA polymerase III subunit alpha [unclassified Candidatus Nanosynbacter]|uniref:DNA polymerase III subunit alpha n=1 Tax=unclassified Candidatus Nanosynbacter TaxID=2725944 RepID=UPI001FB84E48|nr:MULTISPECIES: DNA polymerase III subunit alpha [unclassified Candidatus Nanosynbacter]MCJ1963377.1 DNA polymerase III subunit alpha [Candidatus Nanosynbacter sp. TM7-033]UOG67865.1 DNA polymerase III subunit alpha [Candidatus Nanosynbacter sp. HMT-352]
MTEGKSEQSSSAALRPSDFVHLHNHTFHSVLDGLTKIHDLVDKVKELGMEAAAVTDHGTMSGILDYYKTAKKAGIKPIIGIETYVATRSRFDRDPGKDKQRFHLTVLAMNNTGFHNLMKLSTRANLEGMYYKPRIDHELLEELNEGLIVLSGCASGEIGVALKEDDYDRARDIAKWYKSIFGDRYYLELQDHGHPKSNTHWDVQAKINEGLLKLSKELDIEMVVTCDGHYLTHEYQDAHEILLCVGTGSYLSDEKRMSLKDFELHLTDPRDIIDHWGEEFPEVIRNTKKIADRCDVEIELGRILIPKYPLPDGENEHSYLLRLTYQGLLQRYNGASKEEAEKLDPDEIIPKLSDEVRERAEMELGVMGNMGYEGYFLIVQDFINWGKSQGIVFGPGRGSAAGSIVAYALNITDLDPLKYGLLFERFLNPDRISMPDIDVDIQDTRRDEVIEYCAKKYGEDHVSNIATFGKMFGRMAVRDVARVLEVPYAESDRLAKLVPPPNQGRHIPLSVSIKEDADLRNEYENNPTAKEVLDYAIQLEGTIRSHGVHACGVVIAPDTLANYIPLEMAQKGVVATQFPMGEVEELGLLKMDFLGLSNLTIINNAMRIIRKAYKKEINLSELPLDDKKTYELFQRGDTTGVFQLESAGMKRYLRGLKPTTFEDIIAMVALYRPGPMQFIDSFIRRKHGEEEITYLHSGMKNSLKNTYGILVYQEQFMQISKEWCGFTGGQADTLRKAVGKKKIDLMKKVKPEFVEGAVKVGGATKEIAETFWTQLEEFANYCFNKSHAACYGLIAYWTAYLKAHYPDAFMAALMTSDHDDTDRLAIEITECKHMGISVLSPDVNESFVEFAVVPNENKIRFGMSAVKGVGVGAVEEVLRAREEGVFLSVEDFAKRVSTSKFNRKAWESLIKSGAFDDMGDRSDLLFNLDSITSFASKLQKEAASGQTNLFGMLGGDDAASVQSTLHLQKAPVKHDDKERLMWERELLGLYISAHPLDRYETYLSEQTQPLTQLVPEYDSRMMTVGGIISTVRTIVTKSGSKMAFVGIEDKFGEGEIIVFPNLYEKVGAKLVQDAVIRVSGKNSARDRDGNLGNESKLIADDIIAITDNDINGYESTGRKMDAPKISAAVKKERREAYRNQKNGVSPKSAVKNDATKPQSKAHSTPVNVAPEIPASKLFVYIKDPNDHSRLVKMKSVCGENAGTTDVVLVLGEKEKSAMRLPFKVDANDNLLSQLKNTLGEECVVIK